MRTAGRGAAEVRSAGRGAADAVVSSVRGATAALRGCRPFWHLPELPDRPVRACVSPNLIIEQVLLRSLKTSGGLTGGGG